MIISDSIGQPADLLTRISLAAVPARGRFAGEREFRPRYPRLSRLAQTHPDGSRAERRLLASKAIRPPRLTITERAVPARHRARIAHAACIAREARP